ncbi:MAG: site-2 protease family protein [Anaerolineales bacterium]
MLDSTFRLGKVLGIEVGINISLIFVAVLLLLTFGGSDNAYFPSRFPDLAAPIIWTLSIVMALGFFGSILWHEFAHSLMALYYGIPVARIVLFIFGGIAEIEEEARNAAQEFWITLVGPLSSALLGGLCFVGAILLGWGTPVGAMFGWLGQINIALALFNMIPAFPLDGGRVLRAVLWWGTRDYLRATTIAVGGGKLFAVGFILLGLLDFLNTGDLFSSLWLGFIGWFLWHFSRGQMAFSRLQHALRGISVGHALRKHIKLDPDWSIIYALDVMSIQGPTRVASVVYNNQTVGIFALDAALHVPRLNWGQTRVRDLMRSVVGVPSLHPDTDVLNALRRMERDDIDYMLVDDGRETLGVIGRGELLRLAEQQQRTQQLVPGA